MSGVAVANETFVIGTQTFTWKNARSVAGEVTIGASASAAGDNIVTAILADIPEQVVAVNSSGTVTLTATASGTTGNSLTLSESSTNMAVTAFSGGVDVSVPAGCKLKIKPTPSITTMNLGDSRANALNSSARAYKLGSTESLSLQVTSPRAIWVDTTNAGDAVMCIVEA
jgi:phage tail sheath gpL-like